MKARAISEYIPDYDRTWVVVGASVQCACGHPHFPRVPDDDHRRAPHWGFCEDSACDCHALRRVNGGAS